MRVSTRALALVTAAVLGGVTGAIAQDDSARGARTWPGRTDEIEQFIRAAEVVGVEDIGTGVTNPKRATLVPGGPVAQISFKPISPGRYRGYWESYRSEIAAYELDKLLGLGMIPPTVEKRIAGDVGAAVMWVTPARAFNDLDGPPSPPSLHIGWWNYQLIRAKMFHNLIYNTDPNLGNWLVDPVWNLILIDNSRAFTTGTEMVHALTRIDRDLWDRFEALDEPTLTDALGAWLGGAEIRAILERRDRIAEEIDTLVAARGAADVFVRFRPPPAEPGRTGTPVAQDTADLERLGGALLSALNETPIVLAGSELTWVGRIVRLTGYDGPEAATARAGVALGHTLGLLTEFDGLLLLTRDAQNPDDYAMVERLAGRRAEVFGLRADDAGLAVVQVTLCREAI